MQARQIPNNRSQNLSFGRRHTTARRTEYLARAYACRDMAVAADDERDRRVLRAMTLLWQALAQRASARRS